MIAELMIVLSDGQRIEQPLHLGHAGRRVRNLDFLQKIADLRTAKASLGVREHAASRYCEPNGEIHVINTETVAVNKQ
jgi:hypothetical protein